MYVVSASPHTRTNNSVNKIMRDVFISLLPIVGASIYFYKMDALKIILASVITCIVTEAIWQKLCKKSVTINDFSAAITGLILAFVLPTHVPIWIPIIGGIFAIIVVKQFFGGFAQNFMNPALAAKIFLLTSWSAAMIKPVTDAASSASEATEAVTSASEAVTTALPSLWEVFIGQATGNIGEVSILALCIGALYLIIRGVIDLKIPASYLITVALASWIFGKEGFFTGDVVRTLMTGSIILTAFFCANDYSSTPITTKGKIIFGVGAGLMTILFRVYGYNTEGAYYSILIMNVVTPIIDRINVIGLKEETA
ncbi:RnfABCDGE type electron transport complex subunit D [Clostridium sp. MSJ-4]|uniref:RnfABCDGE type electron transport complex subunit D n=1 Tax=Clostridium simiarum TaxID=2841506 RepID=A0ABS6EYR7_9CLOT|nr:MULTISPECIES: RnfABCDGE type electron transport complex subunit D [Clostridium]MBU5590543.1 RnfABCDGE type electron transport complex subunit D [Clostridium simiarum]